MFVFPAPAPVSVTPGRFAEVLIQRIYRLFYGTNFRVLRFCFTMYPALVALLLFLTAPAIAAPSIEEEVTRAELEVRQLLNEDHEQERSRLHDDISSDAATDGFASDIQEDCRNVPVRFRRSDGVIVTRKVDRCE